MNNILNIYSQASLNELDQGSNWYLQAFKFCNELKKKYNKTYSIEQIAGVVSALSPRNRWKKNKLDAESMLSHHFRGGSINDFSVSTFNNNKQKAWNILEGSPVEEEVVGQKTRSFYDNIKLVHTSCRVTIDTHAISIYEGRRIKAKAITPKYYKKVEQSYIRTAKELGIHPIDLQATTWITYKRIYNI